MHSFVDDNDGFAGYFSLHTHQVKCSSSCLLLEIFYDFPDLYKDLMKHLQKFQISLGLLQQWYNQAGKQTLTLLQV